MTEVKTRPGTWRLRVVTGYDPGTGHPRQASRTVRGTRREAQSALAAFVTESGRGEVAASGTTTVAQLLDSWLDHIASQRSPTTIRGYREKARRICAVLGGVKVAKLGAQDLDRAYRKWIEEGLSPTTVRQCHAVLSSCLHQAVRWGTLPSSPTDRATPPSMAIKAAPDAVPAATVQELVVAAEAASPVLAATVMLAALTGARRGELCGLRWGDVDWERMVLHIRRAVKHDVDPRRVVVGPTKTHQTRRVSIDTAMAATLSAHRSRADGWAATLGATLDTESYILTDDPTGRMPWKPDLVTQAFERLCRRGGVSGLRFHDLRHFSASQLIGAGIDPRTVASRLGHADPSVTLRIYANAIEARDRAAGDVLAAAMTSGVLSSS